ncbi:SNF2 family N-terminal domain-containing protein [Multifurca ochricompacta]|uniref:SNF2 family N-terminal domain-containing protein n=1 Tax=Multifurca ochricompacta TaxID=376703 RepID=A0AAD4QML6_9AGAM|nr:SNF2 family N-terminal domain-containing protein [Multifurca ochricompacta]
MLSFHAPAIFQPVLGSRKWQNRMEMKTARRGLLHLAFPPTLPETLSSSFHGRIDISFLYSVVKPARAIPYEMVDKILQPAALLPTLLPFQRRTIVWMLEREGKIFVPSGELITKGTDPAELPTLWQRVTVQRENEQLTWYYHRLAGTLTPERPDPQTVRGGILAEEPGLGKTLECVALILLNPGIGRSPSNAKWDPESKMTIKEIQTTLIVTPNSLSQQWIDELARHAPSLKVLVYSGWKSLSIEKKPKKKPTSKQAIKGHPSWPAYVNDFNVCITTYDTLRRDLTAKYSRDKRPISPLVVCEWCRVIMDEVREMVSLIPRLSSFAVSGTPARTRVSDLSYILRFLRVDPGICAPGNWVKLIQPCYVAEFAAVFQEYTVRTIKSAVQDELTIPMQTRFVVPVHLGKVERHIYDENLEKALLQLGVDTRGVTTSQNWEVNTALLRRWLRKLRQICTHPQVGQLQKFGDKTYRPGALKTISEVLEAMKDQNLRSVTDYRRSKINEMVAAAQIMQHHAYLDQREEKCLEILLRAEKEADEIISDVLSAITDHDAKGVKLKAEVASLRAARREKQISEQVTGGDEILVEGNGHRLVDKRSPILDDSDDVSDHGGLPKTPAGEEHLHKSRAFQQRLRECYLTLHRVKFLQGDVHHRMGESKTVDEAAAYKAADELRTRLLQFTEESAMKAMAQLGADVGRKKLVEKDILVKVPYCPRGGILSTYLLEEADELVDRVLNAQSRLLWKWRMRIYSLLTQSLTASNDDGEADGQEYSRTLETQGEAETYLQAYAMLLADRREVLSAQRTVLAVYDVRERNRRKTTAAAKATVTELDEPEIGLLTEAIELQPEHEVLKKELMHARKTLLENCQGRAVKSIVLDLTAVAAKISKENDPEKVLAKEGVSSLRRLMTAQATINDQIGADLALFRKAFNERILYFRQLQEISDSVQEAEWNDVDVGLALQRNMAAQAELEHRIFTGRARQRYACTIFHLARIRGDAEECCVLCRCEFLGGYVTQCAHVFCESCMKSWLLRHGKACPVCRFPINVNTLQRFSMKKKDKDKVVQSPEKLHGDAIPKSHRKIEYNTIGPSLLSEIDTMEVRGSYGIKIDTLVRHLLYLQLADPGAKCIVFSAWEDSLHSIPNLRIDSRDHKQDAAARFRNDPDILVLLLHGERQNAGLNVTCASRVFLLESVVHHSFEIQAIARIDRLGQSRPTEVYCYYAEDTVERNILDLAVRRGLSLYTSDRARGTVDTSTFAPEAESPIVDAPEKKQQKGDFIFSASASSFATSPSRSNRIPQNAVPGPSRLG